MHFRARQNVIQVIRTTYDPTTKKARNEVVGRLRKIKPEVTDELKAKCTREELKEIERWISGGQDLDGLRKEYAARTLVEQMERAASWFAGQGSGESARNLASEIQYSWSNLRAVLKKRELID